MALKIRLKRMGNKNRPFYRLVVQDSRWRRDGKTIEDIGWYDPVKNPCQKSFREKEIYKWLERGVQLTETARSLLKNEGILEKYRTGAYKNLETEEAEEAPVTAPAMEEPLAASSEPVQEEIQEPQAEEQPQVESTSPAEEEAPVEEKSE